jgi:hypothetical protein
MEQFTIYIKNNASDKTRNIKIKCQDHYLAHQKALEDISLFREEITCIKDSRKIEVFNLTDGFIFES